MTLHVLAISHLFKVRYRYHTAVSYIASPPVGGGGVGDGEKSI